MRDELLFGLLRQVSVTAADVNTANAQFPGLSLRQRTQAVDLQNGICDIRKRRADSDRFARPQALAAGIGARLGWPVRVDDLPPVSGPRFNESVRESFTRRYDVAADGVWKIYLRSLCKSREQNGRTEKYRDFRFTKNGNQIRAGTDLVFRQQHHCTARYPRAVHLRNTAVVAERGCKRGRVHSGDQIEVIGVTQSKVHVAGMRALDTARHPGRSACVEDRRESLGRVVQPRRRIYSFGYCGQV